MLRSITIPPEVGLGSPEILLESSVRVAPVKTVDAAGYDGEKYSHSEVSLGQHSHANAVERRIHRGRLEACVVLLVLSAVLLTAELVGVAIGLLSLTAELVGIAVRLLSLIIKALLCSLESGLLGGSCIIIYIYCLIQRSSAFRAELYSGVVLASAGIT